jgi:hypothetical protein
VNCGQWKAHFQPKMKEFGWSQRPKTNSCWLLRAEPYAVDLFLIPGFVNTSYEELTTVLDGDSISIRE